MKLQLGSKASDIIIALYLGAMLFSAFKLKMLLEGSI